MIAVLDETHELGMSARIDDQLFVAGWVFYSHTWRGYNCNLVWLIADGYWCYAEHVISDMLQVVECVS